MSHGVTIQDIRGAIARANIPKYQLAALVGLHPARLSKILHGHQPLTDEFARKIMAAIGRGGESAPAPLPTILAGGGR